MMNNSLNWVKSKYKTTWDSLPTSNHENRIKVGFEISTIILKVGYVGPYVLKIDFP
jgi:hypothetical protein